MLGKDKALKESKAELRAKKVSRRRRKARTSTEWNNIAGATTLGNDVGWVAPDKVASTSHLDHVATLKFWTNLKVKDDFKGIFKAALPHLWAALEADKVADKSKVWCISRIKDHLALAHSISRMEQKNIITTDSVEGKEREEILAMFVRASGVTVAGDTRANSKKMIEVTASLIAANGARAWPSWFLDQAEAPVAAMEEASPGNPEAEDFEEGDGGESEGEDMQPPVAPVRASTRANRGRRAALLADEQA